MFIDAVTKMTVKDALGILTGGDGAATNYLKKVTTSSLEAKFQPVIKKSLDKIGVTKTGTQSLLHTICLLPRK